VSAYLDSSVIVKLYVLEEHSSAVSKYVRALNHPLPFTHLHYLETRNGLRLKVFRKEADAKSAAASMGLLDDDLKSGVLVRPELHWIDVFRRADELSEAFSKKFGSRSLDLLHIASALLLAAEEFVTFDDRQNATARMAGLKVVGTSDLIEAS
jgi:predicted nucleic acid-binding protein